LIIPVIDQQAGQQCLVFARARGRLGGIVRLAVEIFRLGQFPEPVDEFRTDREALLPLRKDQSQCGGNTDFLPFGLIWRDLPFWLGQQNARFRLQRMDFRQIHLVRPGDRQIGRRQIIHGKFRQGGIGWGWGSLRIPRRNRCSRRRRLRRGRFRNGASRWRGLFHPGFRRLHRAVGDQRFQ